MKNKTGYICVLLTTLLWGINPIIFKFLSGFASPNVQNFFRMTVAGIVLWVYSKYFIKEEKLHDADNSCMKLISFLPPAIVFYLFAQLFITGISLSKASLASFVSFGLGPIISIIVLGIFIIEERKQLKSTYVVTAIILGSIGAALVMLNLKEGLAISLDFGLFLVLLGEVAWGIYVVFIKKYFSRVSPIIFSRNIFILNSIFFLVTILVTGEISLLNNFSLNLILGLIAAGLVADALLSIVFFYGITKVSAVKANIIFMLAPVISLIVSNVTLNETLTRQQLLGCIITLLASFLVVFMEIKK